MTGLAEAGKSGDIRAMSPVLALRPHPEGCPGPLRTLSVTWALHSEALALEYRLAGDSTRLAQLALPVAGASGRQDGLWRHTCCELFVQGRDAPAYREFNFSPAGDWQTYDFRGYRDGGPWAPAQAPGIGIDLASDGVTLRVRLPRSQLPPGRRLRLGLTAVIESVDGGLAYWALAHAPGPPDFHHPDTFTLSLDLPDPTP